MRLAKLEDPDWQKKLDERARLNKERPIWTRLLSEGHK
jgi:hypothetical protein